MADDAQRQQNGPQTAAEQNNETKKQKRLEAEAALDAARKELEESYTNLRVQQISYLTLAKQAAAIPDYSKIIEESNKIIAEARAKIEQLKENQTPSSEINKTITQKKGILKRKNLKPETRTRLEQEVSALEKQRASASPKHLPSLLLGGRNTIEYWEKLIESRESQIADIKAQQGDKKENKALFDKTANAKNALASANERYAKAKETYFNAQKVFAAVKNVNWGSIAKNVGVSVATGLAVSAMVGTALTPLGAGALVVAPISSVITSTIGSVRKNKIPEITWGDAIKRTFGHDNITDTRKKMGLSAILSLATAGFLQTDLFDGIKEAFMGSGSDIAATEPANLDTTEANVDAAAEAEAQAAAKLVDASILLDGKAANDMRLISQFIDAAKEFGVDSNLVGSVEAKMAGADFIMSADSIEIVNAYTQCLHEALADNVLSNEEYKNALSRAFETMANENTNFVEDIDGQIDDTELYKKAAKTAAKAAMTNTMKLAA